MAWSITVPEHEAVVGDEVPALQSEKRDAVKPRRIDSAALTQLFCCPSAFLSDFKLI